MAKIGRNTPCPCGSGKKYKKCCLRKHEEEGRNASKLATDGYSSIESENKLDAKVGDGLKDPDDSSEASSDDYDNFFEEFRAADFAGKVAIIEDAFDNSDLMDDGESVFELFNDLSATASDIEERKLHYDLVFKLRDNHPEVYEKEAGYLLDSCVANTLIDNQIPKLEQSFKEFAKIAHKEIDIFDNRLDQVAYYGHLDLIVEVMRIGWEKIKDSSEIIEWGIDEYASKVVDYELFYYLSNTSDPRSDDKTLIEKMGNYYELDTEGFDRYFACITRTCDHAWSMDDFDYKFNGKKGVSKKKFMNNVSSLTNEFLDYLHSDEGMSYSKAEMIRTEIGSYLRSRVEGELDKKPSPFEVTRNPKKRKTPIPGFVHILCPDKPTFERFLVQKMNIISVRLYRALACFESIPAWLRFLESKGLIDFTLRNKTFLSIMKLYPSMEKIVGKAMHREDFLINESKDAWNGSDM